ncbi:HPr family phosphocarrier protein [Afifella sp. IM 167]|uniref:HPr family phosphocarrier protein n=1 Tax=Afifella sp. IM 167 TaxID=2033586 RepID=UPI001CD01BFF|nr:HPr family phosphocarrier protein [Afifella sp. IM 167]MBZ8133641.1 HPr family phosphocarrier protein [Afifella sp. IM 167]
MSDVLTEEGSPTRRLEICNKRGLHARASAKFVQLVGRYDAEVVVIKDGQSVGGTSIMGLMTLAAAPGCFIDVAAVGPDADAVLDALAALVEDGFGEDVGEEVKV